MPFNHNNSSPSEIPCTERLDLVLTCDLSAEWSQDDVGFIQTVTEVIEVVARCRVVAKLLMCPAGTQYDVGDSNVIGLASAT